MNGIQKPPQKDIPVIDICDDDDVKPCSSQVSDKSKDTTITPSVSGIWKPPSFRVRDKVYGLFRGAKDPWREAIIEEIYRYYGRMVVRLRFSRDNSGGRRNYQRKYLGERIVNSNHIAYFEPPKCIIPVGCRVIARAMDKTKSAELFFAGTVAEPPKNLNNQRYLIFFDDGYASYCEPENIRLTSCSNSFAGQWWADVHPDTQKFIKDYIAKYPNNYKAPIREQALVSVEWNGLWWTGRVIKVDCSLLKVRLTTCGISIVVWRGSPRLIQIYRKQYPSRPIPPSVITQEEYEGKVVAHKVPIAYKSTLKLDPDHKCGERCASTFTGEEKVLRQVSPLVVPFYHGWNRGILLNEPGRPIYYETPCGKRLWTVEEVQSFITLTKCPVGIDSFNYTFLLDCLAEFLVTHRDKPGHFYQEDISFGQEWVPISKINSVNTIQPPYIAYTNQRLPGKGVFVNTNPNFLVCCDCTDNCEDKDKCACFRLTFENDPDPGNEFIDIFGRGYQNRRLFQKYMSGIYECNKLCKCRTTCINRVVQHGLKWRLQVFYTSCKGYAIRTLQDIPEGAFICVYTGELLSCNQANEDGTKFGDEYLANLDFIESAETYKEDYEEEVIEPEPAPPVTSARRSSVRPKAKGSKGKNGKGKGKGKGGKKGKKATQSNQTETNSTKEKVGKRNVKRKRYVYDDDDEEEEEVEEEEEEFPTPINSTTRMLFGADQDEEIFAIDAKCIGNIGRYLNHSCNPNVFAQDVFLDTHDIRYPWVAFFAMRFIKCGTELTWDYNYQVGSVIGRNVPCNCGAVDCRKRLL